MTGVGVFLLSVLLHTWALLVVVAQINRQAEFILADGEPQMLAHARARPWIFACDLLSWPVGQSVCQRGPIHRFTEVLNSMVWGGAGLLVWSVGQKVARLRRFARRARVVARATRSESTPPAVRRGSAQGHAARGAYYRGSRRTRAVPRARGQQEPTGP